MSRTGQGPRDDVTYNDFVRVAEVGAQLAGALEVKHEKGIVRLHRPWHRVDGGGGCNKGFLCLGLARGLLVPHLVLAPARWKRRLFEGLGCWRGIGGAQVMNEAQEEGEKRRGVLAGCGLRCGLPRFVLT